MEEREICRRQPTAVFNQFAAAIAPDGDEVVRADPDYRRRVLGCIALAASFGVIAIGWGIPYLEEHLREQSPEDALASIRLILMVLMLPVFPVGVSMLVLGLKVFITGSFPAPQMRVIRDTPVVHGIAARRLALLIGIAGLGLAISSIAGSFYIPDLLDQMLATALEH